MPVISMVSSKGGAGKTTTALVLAGEIAEAGKTVTLVDADPNRPIEAWSKRGEVPKNIRVTVDEDADTIIDTIDAERKRSNFVIVDLEGTATSRVGYAISRSDLVIIPLQGSHLDAEQAARSVKLVKQMSKVARREIPFALMFARVSAAIRDRNTIDVEQQMRTAGVPVLEAALVDRAAYRTIFAFGGTLHTLSPSQVSNISVARTNALAITQAVLDELGRTRQVAA